MVNLFDILRQAQNGSGLDVLSQRFGLSPPDMQRALGALLPAFSLAFSRSAQDPRAFAGLLGDMMSGRFLPTHDGSLASRPAEDNLVRSLFGSPDVVRQVAEHASEVTGIAVQVLQSMMPAVAGMLVGGMMRVATVEGFADLLRQWSDALKAAVAARNPPPPRPADPWSAWFELMSGGFGTRAPTAPPPSPPTPPNPFEAWARLMSGAPATEPPKPAPALPPPQPNPFEAVWRMFDAGREIQARNLAAFQSILDAGGRAAAR